MTPAFWVFLAFFSTVMAGVTLAGYVYMRARPVQFSGEVQGPLVEGLGAHGTWFSDALMRAGALIARPGKGSDRLRSLLFRAGYRSQGAIHLFQGVQVSAAITTAFIMGWTTWVAHADLAAAIVPALCAGGFAFLIPPRILELQVKARAASIRVAIPAALDLLVLAIEAGQSLDQALQETAATISSIYPDLSSELVFCNLEMRAGTARPEALRRLGERSGEDELKKLAAVLIDGERFGTSLGPALRTHSKFLRTRMRQKAQEAARKLTVKLVIPVFFLIFPAVMLVTLGPAYLQLRGFLDGFLK